jgi:hypothetical protein
MKKLKLKSINSLYKSCSTLLQETGKIGFIFSDFTLISIDFTSCRQHTLKEKNLFTYESLGLLTLHNHTLGLHSQVLARMKSMHRDPGGAGELAAGEGSPELAHKRHWIAI